MKLEFRSKHSDNGDGKMSFVSEASDISEAADLIKASVSPPYTGESIKSLIRRAAQKTGMTFSRAKTIWYGEARKVHSHEMDELRKYTTQKRAERENVAKSEYRELLDRLERLEKIQAKAVEYIERISQFQAARNLLRDDQE